MKENSFKEFILDQLGQLGTVSCRPMFGGHGLYQNENFFGILFKGRLYFKTDSDTLPLYLKMGMEPFQPNQKQTLKSYYEVPVEIIEDSDQLINWAGKAVMSQLNRRR